MIDKWKKLRRKLFRNKELRVELAAITEPTREFQKYCNTETLPAFTARVSHQSFGNKKKDKEFNRQLISWGHTTPLQSVCYTFYVDGISKSLQNQWVRHKIGTGWTFRSTRYVSAEENEFVYCTYDYVDDKDKVKELLALDENRARQAIEDFKKKKELGATKQDSRKIMPVFWNTPCYFYTNARALRYFFSLRLDRAAEWEIRRMSQAILRIVLKKTPSLFEDIANEFKNGN